MNQRQLVMKYLHAFCAGDIDNLEPLLDPNLLFSGPLYQFTSSAEYLECLASDPPGYVEYRVVSVTEDRDFVAVFYEYLRSDKALRIAQLFKVRERRIGEILLIFDTGDLP